MLKTNQDSKQNLFLNLEIKKTYFLKKKIQRKVFSHILLHKRFCHIPRQANQMIQCTFGIPSKNK